MMTPSPVASSAGSFVVADAVERDDRAMFISSATVQYLYNHVEDGWAQIPSMALAGTFGAGACGARSRWSGTVTATGGTTTSLTTTATINGMIK